MEPSDKAPEPDAKPQAPTPSEPAAAKEAAPKVSAGADLPPATATGSGAEGASDDPSPGPVETDVDEYVAVVQQRAVEISKNVATLASTAGVEAAHVVNTFSETVSGFSTNFVSLFSVFDPAAEEAQAQARAALGSSAGPSQAGAGAAGTASGARRQEASQAAAGPQRRVASRAIDLQANFGLPPEESLLEAFPCRLVQTYCCSHNSFTPDIPKAFNGTLYITDKNVCFLIDQNERRIPIRLKVEELSGVSRELPRGGKKWEPGAGTPPLDQLRISLKPGAGGGSHSDSSEQDETTSEGPQYMLLSNFPSVEDLESALALMEHTVDGE